MSNQTVALWAQKGNSMELVGEIPAELLPDAEHFIASLPRTLPRNAEPVRVLDLDQAEYSKWLRIGAKPVAVGHIFLSARLASTHLGFGYNEVGQRLAHARKHKLEAAKAERGEKAEAFRYRPTAVIRGVTLQYEADIKDV